ncbi:hypothetical protein [Nostoc sp. FACHB-145]|uniref:hypothetical protein n=1 Tax=Nostoc sp. FACHB-145 TaxID=2692836 RepID=UPI001685D293|nr:hypothetical protein [Nostoc sp. FACHB-145]MBD2470941.1 hypothetical protein [Nostoc sp. FACHB-145]
METYNAPTIEHTLGVHSVENFLTFDEVQTLQELVSYTSLLEAACDTQHLKSSVHTLPGQAAQNVARLYSPNGRGEMQAVPSDIDAILTEAFNRNLTKICTVYPMARMNSKWILVSYSSGQFIVPHVDLPDLNSIGRSKIAGLSVLICAPEKGGAFFIETTATNHIWRGQCPVWSVTPGEFNSNFRETQRTRWICAPRVGDALLYGSRLIHGTLPVLNGIAIKALTFIY